MLTYRCTNACRHCLYRCSPRRADRWMTPEIARRIFDALACEPHLQDVHLAGGEAMLRPDLLIEIIGIARASGVPISYLETNAAWCTSADRAREGLEQLARAGLSALLISASMFHNEFIPFQRTRWCVESARNVFGPSGTIVWTPQLYDALSRLPADLTHTLEEFCECAGLSGRLDMLPRMYHLSPNGRAAEALRNCYRARPAESYEGERCAGELASTSHFHIDPEGNLFTGLCPGVVSGSVDDLHPRIAPETHPVFCTLWQDGPYALMRQAVAKHAYEPSPAGYVSKCDLCFSVRMHLRRFDAHTAELRPAAFYAED